MLRASIDSLPASAYDALPEGWLSVAIERCVPPPALFAFRVHITEGRLRHRVGGHSHREVVMLSQMLSAALLGVEANLVRVEVHGSSGIPAVNTVGLPDNAVRESRERVRSAIIN